MHVEFRSHWSSHLGREMPVNRYGHAGLPIIVFPSSGGSHSEYADFGMIDACRSFIDAGRVQFFTLATHDQESWLNNYKSMHDRAKAHEAYDRYVIHEAVPFVKYEANWQGPLATTGCSMGAYHAVNFFLRHPDVFRGVIALSGVYDARYFGGDYGDDFLVYQNSPSDYMWNMNDAWFLDQYRQSKIIISTGLGDWEQDGLPSFFSLRDAFNSKNVPAWFDVWGNDVSHDWVWWRVQMPYFLERFLA